jgi:hypothetical protein
MAEYQVKMSQDGPWRRISRRELRKRLARCVLDIDQAMTEIDAGGVHRSGYGTFRRRPLKRHGSQTRRLF